MNCNNDWIFNDENKIESFLHYRFTLVLVGYPILNLSYGSIKYILFFYKEKYVFQKNSIYYTN
jgi:hypothetical protein